MTLSESQGDVLVFNDGRPPRPAGRVGLEDADDFGRMRAGYICARCFEDLDTPFPDECPVCKFPMRERQSQLIAERYQGTDWVGPSTSLDEERAIMNEMRERAARERAGHDILVAKPQIIIPRGI
jgi:hypothetical protein